MIDITPLAKENLTAFLSGKKIPLKVRVTLPSGCDGDPGQLILVPDQPGPGDISVNFSPLTLCMSRDLYERVGRVQIDYRDEEHDFGFVVDCEQPPFDEEACFGCIGCV
jgi:Fe-S cluster assembly iron-binding protein IscA